MQYDAKKAAMDRQTAVVAVIDEAKLPELIHEVADTRSGRADHLCQFILADSGKHRFRPAFLAEMGEQEEDPGQTDRLLAQRDAHVGAAARRRVPLVEEEVEDGRHTDQSLRTLRRTRRLEGDLLCGDAVLGTRLPCLVYTTLSTR